MNRTILEVSALPVDQAFIVVPTGKKGKTVASVLDYASQQKIGVYAMAELDELISSLQQS